MPAKLLLKQYQDYLKRTHPNLTEIKKYDQHRRVGLTAINTRQRIILEVADNEGVVTNDQLDDNALLTENINAGRHVIREAQHFQPILGTAFTQIAVILNFVLCEHGAPYKDMTNSEVLDKLMMWSMSTRNEDKYGFGSTSLYRVKPGSALKARERPRCCRLQQVAAQTMALPPAPKRKNRLNMLSGR